ncbi:MAG TPA: FtsQ-type POTRA domain-containing protein [bacterium]|nr:FtsQ-type POTRA domain-containing protein [bacterium]
MKRLFRIAVRLSVAVIAAAGVYLVVKNPPSFLRVKEVVVMSPLRRLNEFDLIRLSEVKKGDNILTLRLQDVRKRVLRYPWVKDVRLSKRFPARIFIWVEEEEPAALIEIDSEFYLVSREGKVFKKLDASDPKDFPILTGLAADEIPERLPRLMALVKSLETSDLFNALGVSEARWDARAGLTLFTREPCIQLTLGPEGGELTWEERLQRFTQAWSTIQGGGRAPKVVDLSLDRRVVVRDGAKQDR